MKSFGLRIKYVLLYNEDVIFLIPSLSTPTWVLFLYNEAYSGSTTLHAQLYIEGAAETLFSGSRLCRMECELCELCELLRTCAILVRCEVLCDRDTSTRPPSHVVRTHLC